MIGFLLKKGSSGTAVQNLQQALNQLLPAPVTKLVVDGIFGSQTEEAVLYVLGKREVSYEDYIRILNGEAQKVQAAGLENMEGGQLVKWLSQNDIKVRERLLFLREFMNRASAQGKNVSNLVPGLSALAMGFNTRQTKLRTHPSLTIAQKANQAYDWMMKAWDRISAIQIPIGWALVVIGVGAAGVALYYTFLQDAKDSREDLERKIPSLLQAAKNLDPILYDQLIREIQGYGVQKHAQGSFSGLSTLFLVVGGFILLNRK